MIDAKVIGPGHWCLTGSFGRIYLYQRGDKYRVIPDAFWMLKKLFTQLNKVIINDEENICLETYTYVPLW